MCGRRQGVGLPFGSAKYGGGTDLENDGKVVSVEVDSRRLLHAEYRFDHQRMRGAWNSLIQQDEHRGLRLAVTWQA